MITRLDHVVVLVRELGGAVSDYAQSGFVVTPGGVHFEGATHNALIPFNDGAYIELVAFLEPDRQQAHRWWPRLGQGEGPVDYALLSNDLGADAARIRELGLAVMGPSDRGRVRPDTLQIAWRSIFLGRNVNQPALPFVLQDVTPRELRVPGGVATLHPCGATGFEGLTVLVENVVETATAMTKILESRGRQMSTDAGEAIRFDVGHRWIELLQPSQSDSPASRYHQRFGDGPYEIALRARSGTTESASELLAGNLHGARLRLDRLGEGSTSLRLGHG